MKLKLTKLVQNIFEKKYKFSFIYKEYKVHLFIFSILYGFMLCRGTHSKLRCEIPASNDMDNSLKAKGEVD